MKAFSMIFLALFVFVTVAAASADAGNWSSGRKERKDSKVLCFVFTPWPFRHVCCESQDTDGDGVVDSDDRCPGTPSGAVVDEFGCPLDSDGDGVYDGIDRCPDTPKGAKVDKKGCPLDSDGDGVYDGIDRCPNTPKGVEVDEKGCPVETSEKEEEFLDTGMIRESNILFELGKADLKPESKAVLDEIGKILVQWPDLKIEIGGHTDPQGAEDFNQKLSDDRAAAVFAYLKANFPKINEDNFTTKGYGESKPIASNDTKEGRAQNRRVEFKCLNLEELKREMDRRRR
jgi:OOP family OmpA-OmpF porin